VTVLDPTGVAAEAYRSLRTNLLYTFIDEPPQVVVMTSPGPREGKSTTCANLGVVLAQAGKKVLVVDCDLRKPALHNLFGLRNVEGLVNAVARQCALDQVWREPVPGMKVVCTGRVPPNPAELLGSRRFAELVGQAREDFDYVLLDAPPVEPVSDPLILATLSDGVLLILDAQRTSKAAVRHSLRNLKGVGARVLGTVMNNVEGSKNGYYGYAYE
jgi:receptor protein-tyrosine kinase